ncbi:Macrophage colony-stimulating factor 1 receptor [Microbotryomycetes sp. JL201]|nr:Macrophage colony-stimulating factor 1 receptor [Microbotryomycetes sp. JL201]
MPAPASLVPQLVHLVARDSVSSLRASGSIYLNWLYLVSLFDPVVAGKGSQLTLGCVAQVENIVVVILIIFYFFYFNRIVGWVLATTLRRLYWKRNNSYFEIGGLSFSFLGGEIIFNDVRYISRNQSIRIARGHITWKYWLWKVRSEEDKPSESRLPCRLSVSMHGAEWFLYNRTPAYDAILEQFGVVDPLVGSSASSSDRKTERSSNTLRHSSSSSPERMTEDGRREDSVASKATTDWWREALPIDIRCKTGSIVLGNPSTPTILIAGFHSVSGTYSAAKSRSRFDSYKEVYRMKFTQPRIVHRTNPDYQKPMTECGQRTLEELRTAPEFSLLEFLRRPAMFADLPSFSSLLESIPGRQQGKKNDRFRNSDPGWTGLPRYQPTSEKSQQALRLEEYAKVTTLLLSPELDMTYYCDVAGKVPEASQAVHLSESIDIGNGDLSPEWGIDMSIKGGVLLYGPWADKQRVFLQQAFTPTTYFNAVQTPVLAPGDLRVHTHLRVFVEFTEETIFRIPTREPSKDWQYDSLDLATLESIPNRPYGWLDATIGSNSTICYSLPMVSDRDGYETLIELHLDNLGISSSVNYATFVKAESCRLHCSLPSPLGWDAPRTWTVSTSMSKFDVFLLRDHITLLTDVAKDWTSGPPGDYEHFVPFTYQLDVKVTDYKLRLYVNDHNIINNPTEIADNTFLIAQGPLLDSHVVIPSDKYRMACSEAFDLELAMSLPEWNTHAAFLTDRSAKFATTPELTLDGKYRFYAEAHPDNIERLELNVRCHDVIFKAVGWMIRHMFNFRDNYFGTFTHFVTLEEYRHRHERDIQGDPLELKWRPEKTDVFEVLMTLDLCNGTLLLPQEIYDCRSAVAVLLPHMQVDLRNHDYFMELAVNIEPFRILDAPEIDIFLGLEVTANRLFGPQPRTATYMCIWSFYLGKIIGSVPPTLLQSLARAANAIGYNFADKDNSLPPDYEVVLDPDATFLTVDIVAIDLAIKGQSTAIQLEIGEGVSIKFDDLAEAPFLQHVAVEVPSLMVRALAPLFGKAAPWMEVASVEADFSLAVGLSSSQWQEKAAKQKSFIESQDVLTRRCPFIYGSERPKSGMIGYLYLAALQEPLLAHERRAKKTSSLAASEAGATEADGSGSDQEDGDESEDDSFASVVDDDSGDPLRNLPSWTQHGDRFSSYGAVLRLCERAPDVVLPDRPTFRRLPPPSHHPDLHQRPGSDDRRKTAALHDRLSAFGSPAFTKPVSRTAVDLTSRRPLRFVLTPVSAQVGADVLDRLKEERDFERCLDDIYDDYVSSQGKVPILRYSDLEVRATLPAMYIDSIQDVLRPEDAMSIRERAKVPGTDSAGSTVLCTVRLSIEDIQFTCHQTEDGFGGVDEPSMPMPPLILERKFSGQAGKTRLQVFNPPPTNTLGRHIHALPVIEQRERERPTTLDLAIGPCSAHLAFNGSRAMISLQGGDARLDFVDEAAEIVIGTVWAWRVVHDIFGPLAERRAQKKLFERRLVWSIATASQQAAIGSFPTFLVRASYLYSRQNLRSDDSWKALHQLRHCLRSAGHRVEHNMESIEASTTIDGLYLDVVNIFERWQNWGIDTDDLARSTIVAALFGMQTRTATSASAFAPSAELTINKPIAFEWRSGQAQSRFWIGEESQNYLAFGPFETFVSSSGRRNPDDQIQVKCRSTLHEVDTSVNRDLMVLIRHIAKVRLTFERKITQFSQTLAKKQLALQQSVQQAVTPEVSTAADVLSRMPSIEVDASIGIRHLSARATAEDLEVNTLVSHFFVSTACALERSLWTDGRTTIQHLQTNSGVSIGQLDLTAHENENSRHHLLLSGDLQQLHLLIDAGGDYSVNRAATADPPRLRPTMAMRSLHVRVPREAVRTLEFVEKWKTTAMPEYDSLLSELRAGLQDNVMPTRIDEQAAQVAQHQSLSNLLDSAAINGELVIPHIALEAQAIPTLQVGYFVSNISFFARRAPTQASPLPPIELGFHVGAQRLRFVPIIGSNACQTTAAPPETAFHLPVVRVSAQLDGLPCRTVKVLATIDSVAVKLTMGIVDNFLTVHEHFAKELDELLLAFKSKSNQSSKAQAEVVVQNNGAENASSSIAWEGRVALRGLRVGVKGPHATQWFEAELLEGRASSRGSTPSSDMQWSTSVQNLGLSLTQNVEHAERAQSSEWSNRLAFFRLDVSASNATIHLPDLPATSMHETDETPHLHVRVTRTHAVLQPTAIEALGDLVDFYMHEVQVRRATRKDTVTAIQERVVQTFDELGNDESDKSAMSWLARCILSLEMRDVGIAIPLSEGTIAMPERQSNVSRSSGKRPAFLMALPDLRFAAQKGSAGYARATNFGFYFVKSFDQSRAKDFTPGTHDTMNRIVLPEMKSTVRSPSHGPVLVHSQVSGLEVDLVPSVVAYALSLIDVYELSHERFAKFSIGADVPPTPQPTPAPSRSASLSFEGGPKSVQATFEFESGTIRFHSARAETVKAATPLHQTQRPQHHRRGRSLHEDLLRNLTHSAPSSTADASLPASDVVRLPKLSIWAEFIDPKDGTEVRVHIDAKIHASNNTLRPSLLPFISDVAGQLKRRALQPSSATAPPSPSTVPYEEAALLSRVSVHGHSVSTNPPAALRRLRISISLKVDQSRLEISCLPAAEVTARLTWESGGFLLVLTPDVKTAEFSMRVDGVAAGLRHSFSPEDCLLAEAKGMSTSITFQGARDPFAEAQGQVSAVIDVPDLSAEVNFRHLQDWLCLKAVWLDRMDLALDVKKDGSTKPRPSEREPTSAQTASSNVQTIVQARITKLRLLCDVGQAIGRFNFVADAVTSRLRWVQGESREFTTGIKKLELGGQGRAGGSLSIDGVMFSTRLRDSPNADPVSDSDLLQIQIGVGQIVASLEYEFHKLLVIDADPIAIVVSDDWSSATGDEPKLLLAFDVKMGSFNIITTTSTIPTVIGLSKRVQALMEEKATLADQTLASAGLPPRPAVAKKNEYVVAAVASKLAHDDDKQGPLGAECPVRILNRLQIELARIRIAIFPDHFNDGEVFRLDAGGDIKARLERGVDQDQVIRRDLHLFLGFFSIRKVSHRKISPANETSYTTGDWYELFRTSTERNIFKIGTTEVSMASTQQAGSKRLRHRFTMDFRGQVDLALNYALLRNLGTLAQRYQRHMDRVNSTAKTTSLYAEPASRPVNPPLETDQATEESDLASRTVTEAELPAAKQSVVSMRPTPLVQAATGDSGPLEFEAVEMHVHQPKLTLLGDATPPLEWIGLQRDRFPAWIHTGVSSPLEELLIALSSTYQTQLARQKLTGKRPTS